MEAPIRVLHVDDESDFADLTASSLEREDERLVVEAVTDAEEGLARLARGEFDCVVSDYDMPGRTGIDFLDAVRESHPELPFVLFTGKGSEEVASEAISAGVSDYLQKESGVEQFELLANRILNLVERFRTRRELSERESHFRQAQAVAELGSWYTDIPADELYWSEEVHEIFHIDEDEELLDHEQFLEYVHPEDRADVDDAWNAALDGAEYDIEHRIVTGDGQTRWVRERAEVEFDDDADPTAALGVVQDITDRREREQELRRYERIVGTAGDAIYTLDAEGQFTMVNDQLVERTGYDREELLDAHVSLLLDEDDVQRGEALIRETLASDDREVAQYEATVEAATGERFPVELRISPLPDGGEFHGTVGVARDVGQRKARDRELQRHRDNLEALHEAANRLYAADSVEECYRITIDAGTSILGFDWCTLASPSEDGEMLEIEAISAGTPLDVGDRPFGVDEGIAGRVYQTGEPSIVDDVRQSGPAEPTDAVIRSALTIPVDDWGVFQAVATAPSAFDEHDRRHAELLVRSMHTAIEQIDQRSELRRQNERLDEFASIVSHDLRNPLAVAIGRLELLQARYDDGDLDEVAHALDRMERLLDDLTALSRRGEHIEEPEPVELGALVEDCWRTVETGDVELRCDADARILADRSRLAEALENLFVNAVEHGRATTVTVGELDAGFYVEDDGPGIPPDRRGDVFEAGHSTAESGSGFGLSIVEAVVDAHGWDIRVSEGTDGGARFEITGVEPAR